MLAREESMTSPLIDTQYKKVLPVINPDGSDSAMLDNTLEFLTMNGMDLAKAVAICSSRTVEACPDGSKAQGLLSLLLRP